MFCFQNDKKIFFRIFAVNYDILWPLRLKIIEGYKIVQSIVIAGAREPRSTLIGLEKLPSCAEKSCEHNLFGMKLKKKLSFVNR